MVCGYLCACVCIATETNNNDRGGISCIDQSQLAKTIASGSNMRGRSERQSSHFLTFPLSSFCAHNRSRVKQRKKTKVTCVCYWWWYCVLLP